MFGTNVKGMIKSQQSIKVLSILHKSFSDFAAQQTTLNTEGLCSGIYFIVMVSEGKQFTGKLIVQH